jgi:hypothetical protein
MIRNGLIVYNMLIWDKTRWQIIVMLDIENELMENFDKTWGSHFLIYVEDHQKIRWKFQLPSLVSMTN